MRRAMTFLRTALPTPLHPVLTTYAPAWAEQRRANLARGGLPDLEREGRRLRILGQLSKRSSARGRGRAAACRGAQQQIAARNTVARSLFVLTVSRQVFTFSFWPCSTARSQDFSTRFLTQRERDVRLRDTLHADHGPTSRRAATARARSLQAGHLVPARIRKWLW